MIEFTSKERDVETGLDYFGARYFSGAQGRFTGPDPLNAGAHPEDPQSWNGYAYTLNNPLRYVDPDGESALDFIVGVSNAVKSNFTAGVGRESGNRDFRLGQKIRDAISMAGSIIEMAAGASAAGSGAAACSTGALCVAGAPAIAGGAAIAAHGAAQFGTAASNLVNSVEEPPAGAPIERRRAGEFKSSTREKVIKENAQTGGGSNKCENCGQDLVRVKNEKGKTPPTNQLQVHHDPPIHKGGGKNSTPKVLCRDCHEDIHNPKP